MADPFVKVDPCSGRFALGGEPYTFMGANVWWGGPLGSPGPGGDPARLRRELDRLSALGVKNLRVMAGSEGPNSEPWRVVPALQPEPGIYDEEQLKGLDVLLGELAERQMKAVVCLSNTWQWSGGFSAYVAWATGDPRLPYPGHSTEPQAWSRYQEHASRFYENTGALRLYFDHVKRMVERRSSVTGVAYAEDPTIMAWQLANEPRGGSRSDAYLDWVGQSAQLLKSLAPTTLVSVGSEGQTPWPESGTRFAEAHQLPDIDYATFHVWVQNWMWFEPGDGRAGLDWAFESQVKPYVEEHLSISRELNKPAVLEEFGISRDGGAYAPQAPVQLRDDYYERMFELAAKSIAAKGPLCGINFWAWSGEGRPRAAGEDWHPGDALTGDPPHEPQGWYGVYDQDTTTLEVIRRYSARLNSPS